MSTLECVSVTEPSGITERMTEAWMEGEEEEVDEEGGMLMGMLARPRLLRMRANEPVLVM